MIDGVEMKTPPSLGRMAYQFACDECVTLPL